MCLRSDVITQPKFLALMGLPKSLSYGALAHAGLRHYCSFLHYLGFTLRERRKAIGCEIMHRLPRVDCFENLNTQNIMITRRMTGNLQLNSAFFPCVSRVTVAATPCGRRLSFALSAIVNTGHLC